MRRRPSLTSPGSLDAAELKAMSCRLSLPARIGNAIMNTEKWVMLIKDIRSQTGASIFEAERLALQKPEWRRWVERQINVDAECRKTAKFHMLIHKLDSLIYWDGDRLRVRQCQTQATALLCSDQDGRSETNPGDAPHTLLHPPDCSGSL